MVTLNYGNARTGVLAATVRPAQLQAVGPTNNHFQFQLLGTTGRRYAIEARTNLALPNNWTTLATNQILSNSVLSLGDPGATNRPMRFYRARQLP